MTPRAVPRQGQLGILPRRDEYVHLRRQMLQQKGDGLVNRLVVNEMVVVQNEEERGGERGDFIEQGRQYHFGGRWLRGLEHRQHRCPDMRGDRLRSRDEVSQEAREVVILFIQRQPGGRSSATSNPFADQRRFAEASRGRDEREPAG